MSTPPRPRLNSVLVIGGCGFLGHHVVRLLQEYHPEAAVSVLDLRTSTNRFSGVSYHDGDVTSRDSVDGVLGATRADCVIDTVSPVHGLGEEVYHRVNVDGTRICLDAAREAGVKVFVYTSSASVIFDGKHDLINASETTPLPPTAFDPYTQTKATAEAMVLAANRQGGMLTCALRLSGLFGEGDRQLVPGMLKVLEKGQTKFQIGSNTNLFDFTYIGNSAYAHILAAEKLSLLLHPSPSPPPSSSSSPPSTSSTLPPKTPATPDGEVFIITNDEPVYFWDFPRAIWALRGHIASYHIVMPLGVGMLLAGAAELAASISGKEPGFTRFRCMFSCWNRYFDISKAKDMLGYRPLWGLQEGLVKTLRWIEEEERKKGEKKAQ